MLTLLRPLLCAALLVAGCNMESVRGGYDSGGRGGGGDSGDNNGGGDLSSSSSTDGQVIVDNDAMYCAAQQSKAQQVPLDIYIMLDQSGSMSDPVAGGGTKWDAVTGALKTFLQQGNLTGLEAGIQYFGLPPGGQAMCPLLCLQDADCGACGPCQTFLCAGAGNSDSCNGADYAKPEVEIAALPGASASLIASIGNHMPNTGTPTSAALQGAIDHAHSWAQAHPGHVVIDVFATDGDPSECDTDLNNIDAIAKAGVNGTPSVLTFVIGVGSSLVALDGIAANGGTGMAYLVDTNQNVNQQFLDALNKIRGTALGCQYQIPVPQMGQPDFTKLNVQYTPGNGGQPVILPNVANQGACPMGGSGWYYDNPNAPMQIILCPGSCTTVSADSSGSIDVLLGCQTIGIQ